MSLIDVILSRRSIRRYEQKDARAQNNTDNYPLMGMFSNFNTSLGEHVDVVSNSTVKGFEYEFNGAIQFDVSNMTENQTHGFCRVTILHDLLSPPYTVIISFAEIPYTIVFENETLSIIYFTYEHSTLEIVVVPEFPSFLILPLFMISTLLAVIFYRRKQLRRARIRSS